MFTTDCVACYHLLIYYEWNQNHGKYERRNHLGHGKCQIYFGSWANGMSETGLCSFIGMMMHRRKVTLCKWPYLYTFFPNVFIVIYVRRSWERGRERDGGRILFAYLASKGNIPAVCVRKRSMHKKHKLHFSWNKIENENRLKYRMKNLILIISVYFIAKILIGR